MTRHPHTLLGAAEINTGWNREGMVKCIYRGQPQSRSSQFHHTENYHHKLSDDQTFYKKKPERFLNEVLSFRNCVSPIRLYLPGGFHLWIVSL